LKYRRGTREYTEHIKDIKAIDEQIKSGAFAVVSLVVDDRLFVANVGTAHIFLCFYDKKSREKSIITLDTQHTLATFSELDRLAKLQANLQCGLPLPSSSATLTKEGDKGFDSVALDSSSIKYTRCLGDFKLKYYYHECPEFEYCTGKAVYV
jgi:serine/threonine protein phosphatase PrpC